MTIKQIGIILAKYTDYLARHRIGQGSIYWTGGDIMARGPEWFKAAARIVREHENKANVCIDQCLQSNLLAYDESWNAVIFEKLGGAIGSSLDFPNVYRRVRGGDPASYNETWFRKYKQACDSGIRVRAISLINAKTVITGAAAYYAYMIGEMGLRSLSLQPLFPSGRVVAAREGLIAHPEALGDFLGDLCEIWVREGRDQGIEIEPFAQMLQYFETGTLIHPTCVWDAHCAGMFLSIDPKGNASPCDCFTTRHPASRYGNIFDCETIDQLLCHEFHRQLVTRPMELIKHHECGDCEFLALCHGGCPVHAYTFTGSLYARDPYCPSYRAMLTRMRDCAAERARQKHRHSCSQAGRGMANKAATENTERGHVPLCSGSTTRVNS